MSSRTPAALLKVLSPLRLEARAVGGTVEVVGMGPGRASAAGTRLASELAAGTCVAVAGVAGGLDPELRPGDVVVASEVRSLDGRPPRPMPAATLVAAELRRVGLFVRTGPIVSAPSLVRGSARGELARTGALVVDMESAWLAERLDDPLVVVRAVADAPGHGAVTGGLRAMRSLRRVRVPLERWAGAVGARTVVMAGPRSYCAGVERAIEIVERALERFGPPVYVRRQIVHNTHVVDRLERLGAIFVEELEDVPPGATVVLAAHGVAPGVRTEADGRGLNTIDATCPLVAKVHREVQRFAAMDYEVVLIGHPEHEEVVGTRGEAPERVHVVSSAQEAERLVVPRGRRVAYLTQTTLSVDETAHVVETLRERFADITGPSSDDICYASQNRQQAVRSVAKQVDLVLVVGSANSSNTARLAETARRAGSRAEVLEDATALRLEWLEGARSVGITAGASAPESLVEGVVSALSLLGPISVSELRTTEETVHFSLPVKVR